MDPPAALLAGVHLVITWYGCFSISAGSRVVPGWVLLTATVFTVAGGEVGEVDHVLQMRKQVCVGGWVSDFREVTRWTGVQAHEMGALILSRSPSITLWVLQGKFTVIQGGRASGCKPSGYGAWGLWAMGAGLRAPRSETCPGEAKGTRL